MIGRALRRSEANGELQSAPSWGKPLAFGDGYDETPPELRMGHKILKDAGVLPPEVETLRVIAGRVWVTRPGDPDDHFLDAGDQLKIDARSRALIGAEGEAKLAVDAA